MYNKISRMFGYIDRLFRTAAHVGFVNAWRIHLGSRILASGKLCLNGYPFYFRGSADRGVLSHFYEPMFYIDAAPEIKTVIDLGAHIGDETFKLAMRYPQAKIIAVEPSPSNFHYLRLNTNSLRNVTALQAAIGTKEQKGILVLRAGDTAECYYVADSQHLGPDVLRIAEVDVIDLNSLIARYGFDVVDLLKIDIEGMEDSVFFENNGWINRVNAIVVETRNPRIVSQMCKSGFDVWHSGENYVFIRSTKSWLLKERIGYS